ncbi:lysozyme inhibitor LprI family protein [Vreelandella sp. F11]|uniref:lysozyme inhibitor LprI family protein n=1 Tax=Vreelandella sp. F11 TaxID=3394751 RepID=UPI0036DF5ABB
MKHSLLPLCLFSTTLLASAVVYGEEARQSHDACLESAVTTVDIVACITEEFEREDKRLNDNYQQLRSQLSDSRQEQLLTAQRAWIAYKEANCDFYANPEGGTLARISANSCVLTETTNRADELEALMQP